MIIDHIDFAVRELTVSRAFYVAALAPLGIEPIIDIQRADADGVGFGRGADPRFWIGKGRPVDGRLHVAFVASTREAVDRFHVAALAAGGRDHGAPGPRPAYGEHYYAAFVRDPDGHVVEAVCRDAPAVASRSA